MMRPSPWTEERIDMALHCIASGVSYASAAVFINKMDGARLNTTTIKRKMQDLRDGMAKELAKEYRPTICFWEPAKRAVVAPAVERIRSVQPAIPADRVPRARKVVRFEGEPGGFSLLAGR